MAGTLFVFQQSLAACAARSRRRGRRIAVGAYRRHGNALEAGLGVVCTGIVACGALGACSRRICGIFLIGTRDSDTVVEQYRGTHREVAVGGVGTCCGSLGGFHQGTVGAVEFFVGLGYDRRNYIYFFHCSGRIYAKIEY